MRDANGQEEQAGGSFGLGNPVKLGLLLVLLTASALLSSMQPAGARKLQLWDYWGRDKVPYHYRLDLSRQDGVCHALLEALNHPRPGDDKQLWRFQEGRPKGKPSLYRDPLFLRWKFIGFEPPLGMYPGQEVDRVLYESAVVPLYNDGRDVAVMRHTVISPEIGVTPQALYAYDDVSYFEHSFWPNRHSMSDANSRIELFLSMLNSVGELKKPISPELAENEYWGAAWNYPRHNELNLISFEGRIYAVLRHPNFEEIILFAFTPDAKGHALCFLRADPPVYESRLAPVSGNPWDYLLNGHLDHHYRIGWQEVWWEKPWTEDTPPLDEDQAACETLMRALNDPRPGDNSQFWAYGPRRPWYAPSLYRDPIFLRWNFHPLGRPDLSPWRTATTPLQWLIVPFYNDGKDVAVLRFTDLDRRNDVHQSMRVYKDVAYFKSDPWRDMTALFGDRHPHEELPYSDLPEEQSLMSLHGRIYLVTRSLAPEHIVLMKPYPAHDIDPICTLTRR